MATHDYIISNASGAAVRADLNNALAAIASNNSSATEPTTTYAYQWWADTGSTPTVMKLRNAANSAWITLFQLDGEWSLIPFENGTAAAPSIYFKDSGTDTGIFSPGTDQVGITTGGAVRLTTSTTAFTGTLPWQGQNGTAAAPALSFSGDPNTGVYNVGADNIGVSTNGTLRFDVSTTAITSTLPVVYPLGAVATPSITFTGDLNTGIWSPAADTIAFSEGGAEAMRIDSSSRLLVGTSSARSNFSNASLALQQQIEGTSLVTSSLSITRNSADSGTPYLAFAKTRGASVGSNTLVQSGDNVGLIGFEGADGTNLVRAATIDAYVDGTPGANDMPGRLVFSTTEDGASSPTERMRITNSGNILFGTTGTPNGTSVYGSAFTTQTNSRSTLFCATSSTASQKHAIFYNPNGEVGSISTNASATAYTTSSDYRLKENVTPLTGAAARIQQLKPSRFNFIADPDTEVDGFIAHEAAEVVPECVIGIKDEVDEDGNPVYQGIDQSKLVPLLTAALQEAVAKIESLEARLTAAGI